MRGALGGPRVLLRRLREVMAESVSAQEKLDRIVVLIANNMVAEVCSAYVLRADGNLELYATEGLKREAVHRTIINSDEGLVGLIASSAEPLALSDAQSHAAYSYKPETGEEIYHSFLGVPILRAGNTLGVLVVQNRAYRIYTEEEIEALQTTTMVIAEMVASGDLQTLTTPGQDIAIRRPMTQRGASLSEGIGLGYVVLHEPRVVVQKLIADDVNSELARIDAAILGLRERIDNLLARGDVSHSGEHRDVLETVRMFANDQGWLRRIREAIHTGLTAEGAVERVQSDTRARIMRQTDPYLRERLHDLDELANRLLHELSGTVFAVRRDELPDNAILVARTMGPAALLDYDRSKLRGLVLEEGGKTSHIAIVARALGIPAVSEIDNIVSMVETGDAIIVDGVAGDVQIRPQANVEAAYAEKARLRARAQAKYKRLRKVPPITRDGVNIRLHINAGLLVDMPHLAESGASGVGLFRTELQFMVAEKLPSTTEQQALYEQVLCEAGDAPVTFRTLDIGGDKVLPYMERVEEENPALGWRAIRIALDRPALLRSQVRALLKAAAGRALRIMFPMVATVDEFQRARALVTRERTYLSRHGHVPPSEVHLGVMVEVPSLLFQLDEICAEADFISVGSNDLMQFLFAADRENRHVAGRFDPVSPAAIRALRHIARTAATNNCVATVCGEMSGRPLEAMTLIGIGFRALSMPPAAVGPVKEMLLALEVAPLTALIDSVLQNEGSIATLRPRLEDFAKAHAIPL